jgi:hypothetical protein
MADKFHSDTQERIETLSYTPSLQDSGDLEAGTKTITATTEASGIGNADYSHALTLAKPGDARLVVKRIASRLAVTIDSFDTATHLYCRVYVDTQDADHRLFDEDWDGTGAKLDAVDTAEGTKETIFDLLKDGAAHTFYFFFWVDQANNAIISLVELWEGVGTCSESAAYREVLRFDLVGYISTIVGAYRVGSGTSTLYWRPKDQAYYFFYSTTAVSGSYGYSFVCNHDGLSLKGSVATDLSYLTKVIVNLRNEQ